MAKIEEIAHGKKIPLTDITIYASGDGATSLLMNAIWGFTMIHYTQALGLDNKLTGIAMSIAIVWDAISDPIMGHITDNTRSRFGRRHPHIFVGGLSMIACFYFIWYVPPIFREGALLFWYLVVINLLLRTCYTVFAVAHGALGLQMVTDYNQRTTLQAARNIIMMAVNLAGPAMAHSIFFGEEGDVENVQNYIDMGTIFALASIFFVLFVTFGTRKFIIDSRTGIPMEGNTVRGFFRDMWEIVSDPLAIIVLSYGTLVFLGITLLSALQMYIYEYFMEFPPGLKTIVHGASMVGCGAGSWISPLIARRMDKKPAVVIAVVCSIACNVYLILMFVTGWMPTNVMVGIVPVSMLLFLLGNAGYWICNGIMMPIVGSMVADLAEVHKLRTGIQKDGAYGAMISFAVKMGSALALLLSGYCLEWAGFIEGSEEQTYEATRNVALIAFVFAPVLAVAALLTLIKYPVNRAFMMRIKAELAEREAHGTVDIED